MRTMIAVTIKEAKARLNRLIDEAAGGEQVVFMRGSKHVAALVPVTAEDIELSPRLTDDQAARLWKALADEQARGTTQVFESAPEAVEHLRAGTKGRGRARTRR